MTEQQPELVPAGEQEELCEGASYESMNLAVMVLSDCGHSSNYKPLLERVAGRIDRHVERLLTAQQADRVMWAKAVYAAVAGTEHDLKDVRCECCGYMTYHREHMGCIRAAYAARAARKEGKS